jgi:hypothetical protein
MAFIHGKGSVVLLDGDPLSAFANNSGVELSADSHDVTTYGKNSHVFQGGLKAGTTTISGIYDSTASTGPRAVIAPLIGTVVPFTWRPEGSGVGKPQTVVDVLVGKYVETAPVADMITWSCDLQHSDDADLTAQAS